ncbi:MAG: hypothetical protein R3B09_10440 [Nannocystaceae bacterium]
MKRRHPKSTRRRSEARRPALGVVTGSSRYVFGTVELPVPVEEDGDLYTATALVFLDAARDHAYPPLLVREITPERVAEAWRDLVAQFAARGASPPAHVRTADEALAAALRTAGDGAVEVEVGATPELDAFREAMQRGMAPHGVPASYFHGQPLPAELVREFFVAAAAYRKDAPWEWIVAEDMIDLDIPGLDVEGAAASVITDEGHGGLQLFRDRDLFGPDFDPDDPADLEQMRRGTISVMFYTRRSAPEHLRAELKRIPFAPTSGPIPALVACDDTGRSRRLTPRDYTIAIASLRAVASFVLEHRERLAASVSRTRAPIDDTYVVEAGGHSIEVELAHPGDEPRERSGVGASAGVGIEGQGPRPAPRSAHRLKVTLQGARPPIWRRLEVPSTITFGDLHRVLQIAMAGRTTTSTSSIMLAARSGLPTPAPTTNTPPSSGRSSHDHGARCSTPTTSATTGSTRSRSWRSRSPRPTRRGRAASTGDAPARPRTAAASKGFIT